MSLKGIKIEKGRLFWHVLLNRSDNNQGHVELNKFVTVELALEFAKSITKGGAA